LRRKLTLRSSISANSSIAAQTSGSIVMVCGFFNLRGLVESLIFNPLASILSYSVLLENKKLYMVIDCT